MNGHDFTREQNMEARIREEDSVPDERIEKAAIAIFAAQTNWTEPNPTQKTVKALWDGQMDAIRDSFRRLAKAALDSQEDQPADLDGLHENTPTCSTSCAKPKRSVK